MLASVAVAPGSVCCQRLGQLVTYRRRHPKILPVPPASSISSSASTRQRVLAAESQYSGKHCHPWNCGKANRNPTTNAHCDLASNRCRFQWWLCRHGGVAPDRQQLAAVRPHRDRYRGATCSDSHRHDLTRRHCRRLARSSTRPRLQSAPCQYEGLATNAPRVCASHGSLSPRHQDAQGNAPAARRCRIASGRVGLRVPCVIE